MSMKILAVDDEKAALHRLEKSICKVEDNYEIQCFQDPDEALIYMKKASFSPDIAFLDIEMYGMTGLEMARRIKCISGLTKIIFVTAHSQYALEAFSVHAHGYLLKPTTPEKIMAELEYLKNPGESTRRIQIHTFGNFDIFVDGQPVFFRRSKSKEILAYLVDRHGMNATKREIAAILWEDKDYTRSNQIYLQTLITEMVKALKDVGAAHIIRKGYNNYSVNPDQFDCDYYQFEQGDVNAINTYQGEYMTNYSWAEFRIGHLNDKIVKKIDF